MRALLPRYGGLGSPGMGWPACGVDEPMPGERVS